MQGLFKMQFAQYLNPDTIYLNLFKKLVELFSPSFTYD